MQMEKLKITEYRERLDRTLASPDLTIKEKLQSLVKKQLLRSSETELENVVETRTAEVYNFLDMLRSTSIDHGNGPKIHGVSHADWKLKQDNEEFRVMYREGPEGTPFHTLLVEGYVDGPLDVCLCISWETALYMKWWPQTFVPTFKILSSECLQKIRTGEQISLVRVKVSWPLSLREAVLHYFLFEYLQDDLIVVLLNTVSDVKSTIDEAVHGFSREAIPEAKDVVRIDLVGGFALQKVTSERSYFRTIANMDIKLDFVPPALINFISRQLIGSGFRLYQKAVASKLNSSEQFRKALGEPLYSRIRGASVSGPKEGEELNNHQNTGIILNGTPADEDEDPEVHGATVPNDQSDIDSSTGTAIQKHNSRIFGEIEEEADEEAEDVVLEGVDLVGNLRKEVLKGSQIEGNRKVCISNEVEEALGTLDKIISMVREYGLNSQTRSSSDSMTERSPGPGVSKVNSFAFNSLEVSKLRPKDESGAKKPHKESKEATSRSQTKGTSDMHLLRHSALNSSMKEANMNRIVPEGSPSSPNQESQVALRNETATEEGILSQKATSDTDFGNGNRSIVSPNGSKNSGRHGKNHRYCCFMPKRVK